MARNQLSTTIPGITKQQAERLIAGGYNTWSHLVATLVDREYRAVYGEDPVLVPDEETASGE